MSHLHAERLIKEKKKSPHLMKPLVAILAVDNHRYHRGLERSQVIQALAQNKLLTSGKILS